MQAAPTSSSALASGKSTLPESIVAIHRVGELRGVDSSTTAGSASARSPATRRSPRAPTSAERFAALADACAIVGSHATRAQGTVGGNLMNASPAMETGGPLVCFGATATLRSASGTRDVASRTLDGPGQDRRPSRTSCSSRSTSPRRRPAPGSAYLRLEYRRQMEIAVVGATAVVTVDGGKVTDARVAMTALSPTIRRVPEAEAALHGSDGGAAAIEAAGAAVAAAATPISRRARLGRLPARDGGRDRPPRDRDGALATAPREAGA